MRSGRDVLREADPRERLLSAVADVDRIVLLGDVLELRHGPVRDALEAARPVLASLGDALRDGAEVVLVPGNHDHHLLSGWVHRRARKVPPAPFELEQAVDWRAGEPLADLVRAFGGATVRAAYPGVWLRDGVYATHGHYCDRHTTVPMFERLGAGAMARLIAEPAAGPERIEDYEAVLGPIYAWLYALAQHGGPNLGRSSHGASAQAWRALEGGPRANLSRRRRLRRRAIVAGFPAVIAGLNLTPIGPLGPDLSGAELRRAALRAFGEVLQRLGVRAEQVIFGHTHRAGPLPGDEGAEWRAPTGAQLINSGCWVHEPGFLGPRPEESPYRAGFAVTLEGDGPAELTNLLDGAPARVPA